MLSSVTQHMHKRTIQPGDSFGLQDRSDPMIKCSQCCFRITRVVQRGYLCSMEISGLSRALCSRESLLSFLFLISFSTTKDVEQLPIMAGYLQYMSFYIYDKCFQKIQSQTDIFLYKKKKNSTMSIKALCSSDKVLLIAFISFIKIMCTVHESTSLSRRTQLLKTPV